MKQFLSILFIISVSISFADIYESFDGLTEGAYGSYDYNGFHIENGLCNSENALSGNAVRLRNAASYLEYNGSDGFGKDGGVGNISFWFRSWDNSPAAVYEVKVNINGGGWQNIGTQINTTSTTYAEWSYDLNSSSDNILVRVERVTGERLHIDDFTFTDFSANSPVIAVEPSMLSNFYYIQGAGPSASQSFGVSGTNLNGNITISTSDNYEISSDNFSFQSTGITLVPTNGTVNNTTIYVRLEAGLVPANYDESLTISSADASTQYVNCTGTVLTGEPTNHPTGLTAATNSSSGIRVAWTDSDAENYLIKGNDAGYASIPDPVDGIPESNSLLVQNVTSGLETFQFGGLVASTTYYFKIFPFNGMDATINYKTDGIVPQDNATTDDLILPAEIIINEVDADTPGTDTEEFIELYDGGEGNTSLSGLVVVLFNGNGDLSYAAYDLDGYSTDAGGYFLLGNPAIAGVSIQFPGNTLQNGADAVALYAGDGADFPDGTAVTTANLIDALVYDTDDADDPGLLVLLNSGQPQVNEDGKGNKDGHSNQRLPNGSGGVRNTDTYDQAPPTPGAPNQVVSTWTGLSDADWNTSSNWTNGIPDVAMDAFIPNVSGAKAPQPVVSGSAICKDLSVDAGATLEIESSGKLTVEGIFTNEGSVTVKSDATGSGSLIETSGVSASVEAYIPASAWHFVSSPVDDANTSLFQGLFMQWWDEISGTWQWVQSGDSTLATDLQGYSVWANSPTTLSISGTLNAGLKNINLTNTPGGAFTYPGYNLVGNPYPSGIDWDAGGWTKVNTDNAIYAWNGSQYASYVNGLGTNGLTSEIPPHQGFFVHCNNMAGGSLGITDQVRIHTGASNLKSANANSDYLKFRVSGYDYHDEMAVTLNDLATLNFDGQFDAYKMKGISDAPQIYCITPGGDELSVNAFSMLPNLTITVGLETGIDGVYLLNFEKLAGFENIPVYLEDKKENKLIDIKSIKSYKFFSSSADDPLRFILHFSNSESPSFSDSQATDEIVAYFKNHQLIINSEESLKGNIRIFDLSGRIIFSEELSGSVTSEFNFIGDQGYYIINITSQQKVFNKKLFLNK